MTGRKWFVRGIVFSVVGGFLLGVLLYQRWTNPSAVREQVISTLGALFPGASISVDSARLRILGGIQVTEMGLARQDDPSKSQFVHIPSAILYHDKEKILDGELSIRKVELFKPRLRLQRLANGGWNFEGLTGPPKPATQTLPTIVIHQGTLILEDKVDGTTSSLEISEVNLTLVNDPLPRVVLEGSANSPAIGKLELLGTLERLSGNMDLSAKLENMPLTTSFIRRLGPFCPTSALNMLEIEGTVNIQTELHFQPKLEPSLSYEAHAQIRNTKVRHQDLPLPIEGIRADVSIQNGEIRVDQLEARSGRTTLKARVLGMLPCVEQYFELEAAIDHLNVTPELVFRMPEKVRELYKRFSPQGETGIRLQVARRGTKWVPLERLQKEGGPAITLLPEKAGAVYAKFPYPVDEVQGTIIYDLANQRSEFDLHGKASGRPMTLKGYWKGEEINADGQVDVQAHGVTIDEKLLSSLTPLTQKVARGFNASGTVDVVGKISHTPGEKALNNVFHVRFLKAAASWNLFPYPLENVQGLVHILPNRIEVQDLTSEHDGGKFNVQATLTTPDNFDRVFLDIQLQAENIPVNAKLWGAFKEQPELVRAWDNFQPQGHTDFSIHVERDSEHKEDLKVELALANCSARPVFFPYLLNHLRGNLSYHKGRIDLNHFQAEHNKTRVRLEEAFVDLHKGGYYANLKSLQFQDLIADPALIQALPGRIQKLVQSLNCTDDFQIETGLILRQEAEPGSSPDIYWDGKIRCTNAAFHPGLTVTGVTGEVACVGRYTGKQLEGIRGHADLKTLNLFGQPLTNYRSTFRIEKAFPDVMLVDLKTQLFDGDITGQLTFDFNTIVRYELNLTASQIDLGKFGRYNLGSAEISGCAFARLHLTGNSVGFETIDGNGTLDVPNGKLKTLPVLLDLIKFLGLRWPDRTAFEELHAHFAVNGSRVTMNRLELMGNAISFTGKGDFKIDGTDLNVDFYPSWGRFEDLLPLAAKPLTPSISRNLLIIEMRGKISSHPEDLKFNKKPMPAIVDPLISLRDRLLQLPPPMLEPRREFMKTDAGKTGGN